MAESSLMKKIGMVGAIAAALSSVGSVAWAGFSWADDRWAKREEMVANHVETCKKIEQQSLRQIQTEIFRLEVKKAEASRMTNAEKRFNSNLMFSPVDEAMLSRYKRDEKTITSAISQCEKEKDK